MNQYKERAAAFSIVAFILVEFLLLSHGSSANVKTLVSDQTALYWMLLELLQATVWGASAVLLVTGVIELWQKFALKPTISTVSRAVLIPLMLLFVTHKHQWDLGLYSFLTIRTASIMGYIVAFAAVGAILIAEMALAALSTNASNPGKPDVDAYFRLRAYAQRFLLIAVVTLVAGTLVSLQTSSFLLAASKENVEAHSLAKVFGTIASIALAFFYAPTHAAFYSFGAAARNALIGESAPAGVGPLLEWAEQRSKLESVLQLQITTWDTFGPGISVLAPVLTGLLLGK